MSRLHAAFLLVFALAVALPPATKRLSAEEPTANPARGADEGLDVRYARAYLQLARTDLQVDLDAMPGTIPEAAIEPLRQIVAMAEAELEHALHEDAHRLHKVHIRNAEIVVERAEIDLQRAVEMNRKALLNPLELRRARLKLEVAKLALAKAKAVNPDNASEHTQWQLEELRKELLQIRSQVERLTLLRRG